MESLIKNTIVELQKEYEKLKLSKFKNTSRDNINKLMDLEQDIYRSIFHLERVIKNLPNELKGVSNNEHTGIICKHSGVYCSYKVDIYCKLDKCDID